MRKTFVQDVLPVVRICYKTNATLKCLHLFI